jgi:2-isopropylmalate synthase
MQVELAQLVQQISETQGGEVDGAAIHRLFHDHFVADQAPARLLGYQLSRNGHDVIEAHVADHDHEQSLHGEGVGAIAAFVDAWSRHSGHRISVVDYSEHAVGGGTDAEAAAYVQLNVDGQRFSGAAFDRDTVSASLRAVLSALNRAAAGNARAA